MTDPIKWFRLYGETVDDEKLRLLAFEDRWHYIAILCCKAQGLLDVNDPLMRRKVAVKLGLDTRELDEVARRLAEVGLLDVGTLSPSGWDRRQFRSDQDSTAAERQRRHRAEKKVTDVSRVTDAPCNGHVTRPETETETDIKHSAPKGSRGVIRPESVPESVWTDFVAIRRAKRAPMTATAIAGIQREADKAGLSLADALAMACERGWQGFNASWVESSGSTPADQFAGAL